MRASEREHYAPGSRFVGRGRELKQLSGALDQLRDGRGRMFLVSGEPGIGKTRLADEFSARARAAGLRVMWGRSWEGAGAPAYWPMVQIIRACAERPDFAQLTEALGAGAEQMATLVPQIVRPAPSHGERTSAGLIDPEQARFRLFDAVATLLRSVAQREPLVVVIDDLHDADLGSLQMVRFLARVLKDSPVVLLGTHREAEVERSPELRTLFAELVRDCDQLPLRGLGLDDAADLMRDRTGVAPDAGFVATLLQTTGGNPLFLGGVLQMLTAEGKLEHLESLTAADLRLPGNVRGAIARQLTGLSERTSALLNIASALGIEFELGPLEQVAALSIAEILDCLDEAAGAGIVAEVAQSRGHWRFMHALIRAGICEEIGAADRARLHLRIAETLEKIHAADLRPHLAAIAHHFREARYAGAARKAISYSIKAAYAALALFAFEDAAAQFQFALDLMEQHGAVARKRARLLESAAETMGKARGDKSVTIEWLKRALELYEGLGEWEHCARVHIGLGINFSARPLANVPLALEHYKKAEAVFGERPDTVELANLYVGLSMATDKLFRLEESLAYAQRALEIGERLGNEEIRIRASWECGSQLFDIGRLREGFALVEDAWNRANALDDPASTNGAASLHSTMCEWLFDPLRNQQVLRAELSQPRTANNPRGQEFLTFRLCSAHLTAGQLDEALRTHAPKRRASAAGIAMYHGDWNLAAELFAQVVDDERRGGNTMFASSYVPAMAQAGWLLGHRANAVRSMIEALPPEVDIACQSIEMQLRPDLAYFHTAMGNFEPAANQLERCREVIAAGEDWRGIGASVARAEAVYAAAGGRMEDAATHFEKSIDVSRRYSLPWKEADAFFDWGNALLAIGDDAGAGEKFDAAIEIYRRIGAGQPWIDRVLADRARAVSTTTAPYEDRTGEWNTFRKQGEYWSLGFGGTEFNLKDAKGLHYLAHLLRNSGEQVSAIDLAAHVADNGPGAPRRTVNLGDAGEILDAKARADYRHRLDELRDEIERRRKMNDIGMTERAEAEYDALVQQLSAASGLGGRERRAASHRERARTMVTKRIKAAIENIRASNPILGRHLAKSIHTGHFCCYAPSEPTSWRF